jgi:hypothetical protein
MKVKIGKYKKYSGRKIEVEIHDYDTWSLDVTLAYIILPCLLRLKETKHGVPNEIVNDVGGESYNVQSSFDFYTETHNESFDIACKKWDDILDKMIWSFHQLIIDYENRYRYGKGIYETIELDELYPNPITGKLEKLYKMNDKNKDNHWFDFVGQELHQERIQEGLNLFGKYYRNLWD